MSYTHKFRIWEEEGKIVAFVFHENPISDIYFSLRPGYEELAEEMVTYAVRDMPKLNDTHRLLLQKRVILRREAGMKWLSH